MHNLGWYSSVSLSSFIVRLLDTEDVRYVKDIAYGVVFPLLMWSAVIYLRASWPFDIHPWQPLWVFWVLSMSTGAFLGGVAFHAYWFNPSHPRPRLFRRDDTADADKVQLAADESVPDVPRDGLEPPTTPG